MRDKTSTPGKELEFLADALIEDLLATTDGDFLGEVKSGGRDPKAAADRMRAIVQKANLTAAKGKLSEAKLAVAAIRAKQSDATRCLDPVRARQIIKNLAANDPELRNKLTLAARNEAELSDEDIRGIIEDLRELGVLPAEDDTL